MAVNDEALEALPTYYGATGELMVKLSDVRQALERQRVDGTIIVQHDDGGGYQAPGRPDNIAGKILYRLAKDILAAAPEPGERE